MQGVGFTDQTNELETLGCAADPTADGGGPTGCTLEWIVWRVDG